MVVEFLIGAGSDFLCSKAKNCGERLSKNSGERLSKNSGERLSKNLMAGRTIIMLVALVRYTFLYLSAHRRPPAHNAGRISDGGRISAQY